MGNPSFEISQQIGARKRDRDGATRWKSSNPMSRFKFRSDGRSKFTSISSGKEATRQDSSIVRVLATNFQMIQPKMLGHVLKWMEFVNV